MATKVIKIDIPITEEECYSLLDGRQREFNWRFETEDKKYEVKTRIYLELQKDSEPLTDLDLEQP